MSLKLYFAPGACSFVPHVLLEMSGAEFEPSMVKLHKGEQNSDEYKALNPRGQVPVLVNDGQVVTQIVAIVLYLDQLFPQAGFLPTEPLARAQALSTFAWMNNTVHPTFTHIFMPQKFSDQPDVQATHTVNQLLSLARAEGGGAHVPQQNCDMASLASEVLQDCLPRAMDKGLDLGYEGVEAGTPGAQVQGNPTLLKEMVRNLVENAIHYTPSTPERQGVITVRVLVDPYSKALVMQIEDNGPGIPPAERDLVFQPFYRALGTNVDGSGPVSYTHLRAHET